MSNTPFVESMSTDPVERAIARNVNRVLNDPSLDRQQRETLIKRSQRDLLSHRQQKLEQQKLQQQVAGIKVPHGYKPQSVLVRDGRVISSTSQLYLAGGWGGAARHGCEPQYLCPGATRKDCRSADLQRPDRNATTCAWVEVRNGAEVRRGSVGTKARH
jgi:hypothetical protein